MFAHRLLDLTVTVIAILLTGCATTQVPREYKLGADSSSGVVVFAVTHDLAGDVRNGAIIYLDNGPFGGRNGALYKSSEDSFFLSPLVRKSDYPEVFGYLHVVTLPTGPHEFTGWQITNGTGLRIFPREDPPALRFEVKAGEVQYFGAFHADLKRGKNFFGMTITGGGLISVKDENPRDVPILLKRYPQFEGKVRTNILYKGQWVSSAGTSSMVTPTPPILPSK